MNTQKNANVDANELQACSHIVKFNRKEHVHNGIQHLRTIARCAFCSYRTELNTWLPINKDNTFGRTYGKLV